MCRLVSHRAPVEKALSGARVWCSEPIEKVYMQRRGYRLKTNTFHGHDSVVASSKKQSFA